MSTYVTPLSVQAMTVLLSLEVNLISKSAGSCVGQAMDAGSRTYHLMSFMYSLGCRPVLLQLGAIDKFILKQTPNIVENEKHTSNDDNADDVNVNDDNFDDVCVDDANVDDANANDINIDDINVENTNANIRRMAIFS
ncbi:hypothetical protein LXL04_001398 [Taraxacum kok-saghyz]